MKKAVIYARYSSDKQTEQSIEGQLYDCYNYAKDNSIQIVREYIDRALTGKNDDRPSFQQMIKDSALKQWDYVLVWKLDRFARNTIDSAIYRRELKKNGVKILSVMEAFGEDPTGQMMERIVEAMNEFYSADLREKTIRGMRQSAMKCNSTGGHIPIGYKIKDKKLVIDEEKRVIPETAFKMYADGVRLVDIANTLNEKGYRTKNGKKFTVNSFYCMLSNEKYIGVYHYGDIKIEGGCPSMISQELFDFVQKKLQDNKKRAARNTSKADYILSGKLFCGHCGEPMSGLSGTSRNGDKHYYYRCNGVQKKTGCTKHNEVKADIEKEICILAREAFSKLDMDDFAERVCQLYQENMEIKDINSLETELKKVQQQEERTANAIAEIGLNSALKEKLQGLELQKEALQSEIRVVQNMQANIPTKEDIKKFADMVLSSDTNSYEGRKWLISIMIKMVYAYDDRIQIIFNGDTEDKEIPISSEQSNSEAGSRFVHCTDWGAKLDKSELSKMFGFVCILFGQSRIRRDGQDLIMPPTCVGGFVYG